MSNDDFHLVKVAGATIRAGKLEFDIYDQNGNLLLPRSHPLGAKELEKIREMDVYRYMLKMSGEPIEIVVNSQATLPIGKEVESFHLLVREGTGFRAMPCKYIGWIQELAIAVEMPVVKGDGGSRINRVDPGQKVQCKFHSGSYEYAFQSYVMCVATHPVEHMFIKHPGKVNSVTLRKSSRISTSLRVRFRFDDGEEYKAEIVDLSSTGCAFLTEVMYSKGAGMIYLPIHGREQPLAIRFVIRSKTPGNRKYRYGVEFTHLLDVDLVDLKAYIYGLIEAMPG